MKQIWKYTVDNIIEIPKGAEVLTVQMQSAFNPCIWVKVLWDHSTGEDDMESFNYLRL